jgi:predicted aldo/keto reductase-like oxidoreductase
MIDFRDKVTLGRTGLAVSRLGIGSSYGVSRRACLRAFDAGVNYFYWGSVRTRGMGLALRDLGRGHRDELVVVLQSYLRGPRWLETSVERGLRSIGVEHADVLLLGWHDVVPRSDLLETAARLRAQGRVRFLGISSHMRPLFPQLVELGQLDVFHLRYNAAHRGAETEIFPFLPEASGPGVVSYTNTRWGDLLDPKNMPPGMPPPSATDCYRFALTDPHVQVAMCGPADDGQMQTDLATLAAGPHAEDELARMRRIGDFVHSRGKQEFGSS